ncbi:MAG: NAD(P)-dependent oxidoreductase [Rhodobacteraceae bacterium]|nr:NAD(P)-dependent oxidoreductase [Paracoccaceae bacterium]
MTKIAFLGLGAMGRRMAAHLIAAGHDVTVWNRSPDKASDLNAKSAVTPEDAVAGADAVLTMLTDDTASTEVWSRVAPHLGAHALTVEMSTVSPDQIARLRATLPTLIDAPVAGSLPQADAGELIFLTGGAPEQIDRFRPLAEAMGKAVLHAGDSGKGAALKLAINTALGIQTAMMAELLRLGQAFDIAPATLLDLLAPTPVMSGTATVMGNLIAAGKHDPLFPVDLLIKNLGYALGSGADMPVTQAVLAAFEATSAAGHGDQNISAIAA